MTITDTAPATALLTDAQRRAVAPLVYGGTNESIGAQIYLPAEGVASHLRTARTVLGRRGCSRPVLVHALITARVVPPPDCRRPCPAFTARELRLYRAVAEYSLNEDIGRAIGVSAFDVRAEIDALVAKAGADDAAHLVGLGHAWNLLGASCGGETSATAGPALCTTIPVRLGRPAA
ncbi:sigma-70 family RNA polymerase sigma factor [Streptomyces sp. NPDC018711]|uniref:sigma-70 family RNA polymerase sigma factor n=1 Tax=Streptomyces sp. NPDC018711 TaxID=3365052 RepID=UPI0037A334B5